MGLRFPRLAFSPSHLTDHPVALPDPISALLHFPSSTALGAVHLAAGTPPAGLTDVLPFLLLHSSRPHLCSGHCHLEAWKGSCGLETCRVHVHLCCRHVPRVGLGISLHQEEACFLGRGGARGCVRVRMCTCSSGRTALYLALALAGCVSLAGYLTSRVASTLTFG